MKNSSTKKKSTQPAPQEAASQQMQGPSLGAPSSFRGVGRIGASEGQGGPGIWRMSWHWLWSFVNGGLIPVTQFMTSLDILGDYVPHFLLPSFFVDWWGDWDNVVKWWNEVRNFFQDPDL